MNIDKQKFSDYLMNKGYAQRTLHDYLSYFDRFFYDKFNQQTVLDYLARPGNDNDPSRAFINNLREYLLLNKEELLLSDELLVSIASVKLPKKKGRRKKRKPRTITEDQVNLIEEYLHKEHEKVQLQLSFQCGLRLQEMLKITPLDFDWQEWSNKQENVGHLHIREGKGNKDRTIPVPPKIMIRIARYIRNNNITIEQPIFKITKHKTKKKNIT